MKNRVFTGTLILLVLLTCGIFIKADSQIQTPSPKFKVAVRVNCDNQVHQSLLEGTIKRELRSFGDVQIVGSNSGLWKYLITVNLFGIEEHDGKVNAYATSTRFYIKIPIEHIAPHWQEHYRESPAVYLPTGYTGVYGINKIETLGKTTAADFDKGALQPIRDIQTRNSR